MPTRRLRPPARLLVVLPSWVGDTVMATPALARLRAALPGCFIGALARPGLDELLAGLPFLDHLTLDRAAGMMGPKRVAAKLRLLRYDTALLFTNSFSTALTTRLAAIPRRIGYDRDARALLLTDRLTPARRRDTPPYDASITNPADWAPVPAVDVYLALADHLLCSVDRAPGPFAPPPTLNLVVTAAQRAAADALLAHASPALLDRASRVALLAPGGNNPAKRWPPDRFAALAVHLVTHHALRVLIVGSPAEHALAADITARAHQLAPLQDLAVLNLIAAPTPTPPASARTAESAPSHGAAPPQLSLGSLKGLLARAAILITNDTGPRHVAAALGTPVVTLFGPTDHRWTTIPFDRERRLLADPSLPEREVANDHPERCRIDRITLEDVAAAADELLSLSPD